jgi:DNA-binding NtrC family response regulator
MVLMPSRVLIVDDEDNQRQGLAAMVSSWGFATETAGDGQEALDKLQSFAAHAIVTDMMMPRVDGAELLRRLASQGSATPVIMLTAFGGIENALKTVFDLGAFWFLEKPVNPQALRMLLDRATSQSRLTEETARLQRQLSYQGVLGDMVGTSAAMRQVFALVQQVAPSRASVLITGDSGTGKEVVARTIHALSPRAAGPFVAINCAAMPESLMESELFGHEKGSFTGAVERRVGCFELAHGGTLLLDEIGDMPVATQAKLLRVLEDSRVRRLGAKNEIDVDVRVIAATNKVLEDALKKGQLREDLYYRLNVFQVHLPPLRQRKEDIPALVNALLPGLNAKHACRATDVHSAVMDVFTGYDWPGNVRELRHVLERAVILVGEGSIRAEHLPPAFGGSAEALPAIEPESRDSITLHVGVTVGDAEKALIFRTLDYTGNNKTRAAEILGISLKTLHNKLKEYSSTGGE